LVNVYSSKGKSSPQNRPRRLIGGAEVQLYSFFTLGARWEWLVEATLLPFYPPGKTRYPFYRRLGRPQARSQRLRKVSPPLPPTGKSNNAFCIKYMLTNVSVYYQNTNLLAHCITLTCFNPQRAILRVCD